jgi:hypothetical protein
VDAQPREVDVHPQQGCRAGTRTGQNHIHLRSPELFRIWSQFCIQELKKFY